ncbi:hypothetical protein ACHAWT_009955 [Skeletonema menzelii]
MSKKDSKNKNSRRRKVGENNDNNSPSKGDSSDRDILFQYLKLQASIRLRQLGYVGSDFSVHLPPASPALLLLYMLPKKQDPLRRLVKFTMTTAAVSWMHSEATKYRRLAPLPVMKGCNVRQPNLPPFLPEERVEDEKKEEDKVSKKDKSNDDDSDDSSSSTQHGWDLKSFGTISSAYRTWLEAHNSRKEQSYHQRRKRAQETLLALRNSSNSTKSSSDANTGYALVTGASRGIGRAIAVELARYNIPLILVARDLEKLSVVAKDLIDGDVVDALRMIQLNVGSVVELSRLYGKNMKDRRRGRILFVSSMSGAMPGCPSVAVYAATKSFEKSLASSLGRELERYGVGVTCLLPGAVEDTSFASASGVEDAACFHFPGYAKTPELVAGEGIKGLMLGYPEVYPGWQNSLFVKMGLPMLPSRVSMLLGEWAWNPWQWGDAMPQRRGVNLVADKGRTDEDPTPPAASSQHVSSLTWKFRRPSSNQMQLPDVPKETKKNASQVHSVLPTPQFVDATASNLVPNEESLPSESEECKTEQHHQEDIPNEANEPKNSKSSVAESTTDEANNGDKRDALLLKEKPDNPAKDEEENPQNNPDPQKPDPQKKDAFFIGNTSDVSPAQPMSSVLPLPPPKSEDSSTTPSATPLLGFFDKDKALDSNSPLENDSEDQNEKKMPSNAKIDATVEIFPSMLDSDEYDFRDRRLDYTKLSFGKSD